MEDNKLFEEEYELRQKRILDLSDRILEKIESSLDEVNMTALKTKERLKTTEYDEELKKPVSEEVRESERVELIQSTIDTSSLKQIVATLKDVKDIHLSLKNQEIISEDDEGGVIMISDIEKRLEAQPDSSKEGELI